MKKVLIIVSILVVFVGIGVGVWYWQKNRIINTAQKVGGENQIAQSASKNDIPEIPTSTKNIWVKSTPPVKDDLKNIYVVRNGSVYYIQARAGSSAEGGEQILIDGADSKTFEYLGNGYAKDVNQVYYFSNERTGALIVGADPKTFEFVPDHIYSYSRDNYHVYGAGVALKNANPKTFQYLGYEYGKDTNLVYFSRTIIEDADPNTFVVLNNTFYSKDAGHAYLYGTVIDADPKTFECFGGFYCKDAQNVFASYASRPNSHEAIAGADLITFEYLGNGYAKDANHAYYEAKIIAEADSATFQHLTNLYAKDAKNAYFAGKIISGADPKTFGY